MATKENADLAAVVLTELQRLVRRNATVRADETAMTISIPEDLATPDARTLILGHLEAEALSRAKMTLEEDLRFEHLGGQVADPLQRKMIHFASQCAVNPSENHVPAFVAENEQVPEERTCFLGIEFLKVQEPLELFGLRLLPTDHDEIPDSTTWFSVDPPVGSVIAVPVEGTNLALMKDRASATAERSLRTLRVALRENPHLNPLQFRFRLSEGYSFGGKLAGWQTGPDARWEVTLDRELLTMAESQAVAELAREPRNDLQRHAARAMSWIEDSMIEADPLKSLLFLFFALEAMLGDRSEGLKAHGLAYRRTLLSLATKESFTDPSRAYLLYDEVRSAAVHGEEAPPVSDDVWRALLWDVRLALNEYLELAARDGFQTRRRVLRYLRGHPDRPRLDDWLLEFDEVTWKEFLSDSKSE